MGIHWHLSFIDFHVGNSRKKRTVLRTSYWRQEWWVNRVISTGLLFSESELSELCQLADCCMRLSLPSDKSFVKTRHKSGRGWFGNNIWPSSWRQMFLPRRFFPNRFSQCVNIDFCHILSCQFDVSIWFFMANFWSISFRRCEKIA